MFKKVPPPTDSAFKVLEFIRNGPTGPHASAPVPVDRDRAAQVIAMPARATTTPVAGVSVKVISMVTEQVDKLFPQLKGAIREDMITAVSRQIAEDPRKRV